MSFYDVSKIQFLDPSERTLKRLFWRDNCEAYDVVKWGRLDHVTSICEYSQDIPAFEGDYVLELDDTDDESTSCQIRFGMFPPLKHSVELWWYRASQISQMLVDLGLHDGVQGRTGYIRWNAERDVDRWEYYYEGAWHTIPKGSEYITVDTWNRFKMIIDWKTNRYVRMESTGLYIELNAPLQITSQSTYYTRLRLYKDSRNPNRPIYFDDIRLYQNEVV